ncbi:MAG: T9SS type A sorting domain-containing protein [Candidatus Cloacimonetes bacterium]|nr:T9SS type A sorting domain-containing protein [Candidatus Cloacimonadota bacterium]
MNKRYALILTGWFTLVAICLSATNLTKISRGFLISPEGVELPLQPGQNRTWQPDVIKYYSWEGFWQDNTRTLHEYDGMNRLISTHDQEYDSGTWQDYRRIDYSYDLCGLNQQIFTWYYLNHNWMPVYREDINYSGALVVDRTNYSRINDAWQPTMYTLYDYDGNLVIFTAIYSGNGGDLEPLYYYYYTYDDQDRMIQLDINNASTPPQPYMRYLYTYTAGSHLDTVTILNYEDGDQYENYMRCLYSYDAQDKLLQLLGQQYTGFWMDTDRLLFSYPGGEQETEFIYQYYQNSAWQNISRVVQTYLWVSLEEECLPSAKTMIKLYPNPCSETLRIRFDTKLRGSCTASIYNARGQLMAKRILTEDTYAWDLRDSQGKRLPSGIYFLRFEGMGLNETKKLLLIQE